MRRVFLVWICDICQVDVEGSQALQRDKICKGLTLQAEFVLSWANPQSSELGKSAQYESKLLKICSGPRKPGIIWSIKMLVVPLGARSIKTQIDSSSKPLSSGQRILVSE